MLYTTHFRPIFCISIFLVIVLICIYFYSWLKRLSRFFFISFNLTLTTMGFDFNITISCWGLYKLHLQKRCKELGNITKWMNSNTFTSRGRDLSKGVIAAVALTTYDSSLTGALSGDGVARPRLRADWEALAGVTGVLALGTIVVVLWDEKTRYNNEIFSSLKESRRTLRYFEAPSVHLWNESRLFLLNSSNKLRLQNDTDTDTVKDVQAKISHVR